MTTGRRPGAVVLGLGFSGVGALHSLSELRPRPSTVIGVDHNPKEIGLVSRVGPMLLAPPPWDDEGNSLRERLLELAREVDAPLVLYPCGDDYVSFVSKHREALSRGYRFLMPDPEVLRVLINKAEFAERAQRAGLNAPSCAVVQAVPDLRLPDNIRFPIVAKAVTSLHSDPFWGLVRVRQFDTPESWSEFFSGAPAAGQRIMIQELVDGDDTHQYVYEGLWSEESEELAGFSVRKIRQQPPRYGSSARAVCLYDEEVHEQSRRLLKELGYRGLVDIDFKRDSRDGSLKVMEVNPRLGGIHRVGRRIGIELVQDAYRLANGEVVRSRPQRPGRSAHWCHFSKDLRGLLPQLRRRPHLVFPWLASYRFLPMDALFTWQDPGPWAKALGRLIRAVVRELRSGRWKDEKE